MGALLLRGFKTRDMTISLSMKLVKAIVSMHLETKHSPPAKQR